MIADLDEVIKFIKWLKPISEHEAYLLQLMIRSSAMKKELGFKGSDHVLMFKTAHGYLTQRDPRHGWELWRTRLLYNIRRMAKLMEDGLWEYVRHIPGTRVVEDIYDVPKQILALYIQINPSNVVKAATATVREVVEALGTMATSSEPFWKLFRRPDTRYYANLARYARRVFHTVDVDTKELVKELEGVFKDTLGLVPDMIVTAKGAHFLVDLEYLEKSKLMMKWAGPRPKELTKLLTEWKQTRSKEAKQKVIEYAMSATDAPLYHRLLALQEVLKDKKGASLVEVKKQGLEPVPGVAYKGVVPRFITRK